MFDVKETDYFDIEDDTFDTVLEPGIRFTGNIKFIKPFMIRGKVNRKRRNGERYSLPVRRNAILQPERTRKKQG